jgi:hypothetical protein
MIHYWNHNVICNLFLLILYYSNNQYYNGCRWYEIKNRSRYSQQETYKVFLFISKQFVRKFQVKMKIFIFLSIFLIFFALCGANPTQTTKEPDGKIVLDFNKFERVTIIFRRNPTAKIELRCSWSNCRWKCLRKHAMVLKAQSSLK